MKGRFNPHKHLNGGEDSATNLQNVLANFWVRAVMLCVGMVALGDWICYIFWGGWNSCGILAYKTASEDAKTANRSASDAFLTEPWSMVGTFLIFEGPQSCLVGRTTTNYFIANASQDQAEQRTRIHALL